MKFILNLLPIFEFHDKIKQKLISNHNQLSHLERDNIPASLQWNEEIGSHGLDQEERKRSENKTGKPLVKTGTIC